MSLGTVCLWTFAASPAFAQWYVTYDDGLRALSQRDWKTAEAKLLASKQQAQSANTRPGRSVLRQGGLFEPFLPDYYLSRVYYELARTEKDAQLKKGFLERAVTSIEEARKTNQVRSNDPENGPSTTIYTNAKAELEKLPPVAGRGGGGGDGGAGGGGGTETPPDTLATARRQLQNLLNVGNQALADRDWEKATGNFQTAQVMVSETPALGSTEAAQIPARLDEAALGSDITNGVRLLRGGTFDTAFESLQRAQQTASRGPAPSSTAVRGLVADLPSHIAEAQIGQNLVAADTAAKAGRWKEALAAFQTAQQRSAGVDFISPRAKTLVSELPGRINQASLQLALSEKRFADALAIAPTNIQAIEGQYALARTAYDDRRWDDAYAGFTVLNKANARYRDVAERLVASNLQQEFVLGIKAEDEKAPASVAREHYERVLALNKGMTGVLRDSDIVAKATEDAAARITTIDADGAFQTAERLFQSGDLDQARNSARLALRLVPRHPGATGLLAKLDDSQYQSQIKELSARAQTALQGGDLGTARTSAEQLAKVLPGSTVATQVLTQISALESDRARRNTWLLAVVGVVAIGPPLLLVSPRRRGRFMDFVGQPGRALKIYEGVLARNPADAETLSRAVALVTAHGLATNLDDRFEAYLKAKAGDPEVAAAVADHFWTSGNRQRAVEIYEQGLAGPQPKFPVTAYDRLAEVYEKALPAKTLSVVERASATDSDNAGLSRLLAREYSRGDRSDATALAAYKAASAHDTNNAELAIRYARTLLLQGQFDVALNEAERAARLQADRPEPLELMAQIYLRAHSARPPDALSDLARRKLPVAARLVIGERLAQDAPAIRSALAEVYARDGQGADDTAARALVSAHRTLDEGNLTAARGDLDRAFAGRGSSMLLLRALIEAHRRYVVTASAGNTPVDPEVRVRVAQLNEEGNWWLDAIVAWQQTVSIPEWNRRSMTAIENILDRLPLGDLAQAYFSTAGWQVNNAPTDETVSFVERSVSPKKESVTAEIATLFVDTQVFCFPGVVTVDDVVGLKRKALERKPDDAIAFLVAGQAIRHDVYALIYAFMTEDPSVTLIPLEAQTTREAIVEGRSRTHLERTLHQWLGHTDVYEAHNPVSNAATFFGRGHFINQLVLKISRGENFGIFGLRKIGKTSLVYRLRELSRDHLVAYVDLQGVSSRGVAEVYGRLVESLVRDMRVKHPDITVPSLHSPDDASDVSSAAGNFHSDVLAIRQAFERSARPLPHVLLLLDEIELMVPTRGTPGFEGYQDFFRHIRGLYQQERFVVSAVVGASPAVCRTATWDGRDNPVFQFYDEVFLAPLDRTECDQMVQGLGEVMGVRFDPASLRIIYEETAGHPYVARQLCSRLVKAFPDRPLNVTEEMAQSALETYLAQRGEYFLGIVTGYLSTESRAIVETIAALDEDGADRSDILAKVGREPVSPHLVDQELGDMELTGLVRRQGTRYSLKIPLFRRWLRRSWLGLE